MVQKELRIRLFPTQESEIIFCREYANAEKRVWVDVGLTGSECRVVKMGTSLSKPSVLLHIDFAEN